MGFVTPDYGTIFWMLIIFGTAVFILKKFAWKPILHALKERENSIADALSSAQKARKEMEKLKAGNEKVLAEARKAREEILHEARDMKEQLLAGAKAQAVREGEKMIEAARLRINAEKEEAIADIKKQVAELSVRVAEKIIQRELKEKADQEVLVNSLLSDLNLKS
ncbi:MAG: F0F1 ATP synthase subunit B [Mangrovibacterium sp.]|nr:F0F1 ATP synthase subunit B [Mangrovibacterium sp.]